MNLQLFWPVGCQVSLWVKSTNRIDTTHSHKAVISSSVVDSSSGHMSLIEIAAEGESTSCMCGARQLRDLSNGPSRAMVKVVFPDRCPPSPSHAQALFEHPNPNRSYQQSGTRHWCEEWTIDSDSKLDLGKVPLQLVAAFMVVVNLQFVEYHELEF